MIRARHRLGWLCMGVAGLFGTAILLLLTGNVVARMAGFNLIWVSETSRVLFVWGVSAGMIAVSLKGQHFRVDMLGRDPVGESELTGRWEIVLQVGAAVVLAYIAWFAAPTISRAATQSMSSIPLTYGTLRAALVVALTGMCLAHVWRATELTLGQTLRRF